MIKYRNVDPKSGLHKFNVDFVVTAIYNQYVVVPVECKLEKITLGANSAGSTATTVEVTRMSDDAMVGSGTFTSGTVGVVLEVQNAMDVSISQGTLLSVNTSGTTVMEHTVGLVFDINGHRQK
ncbi:MAG: hypothetical protein EHM49_01195 [Deltaproteobacteria bacterium]|nr:MAG: hypothetical protein EHM49_01195 [Deltaproteobacteria bacterium]